MKNAHYPDVYSSKTYGYGGANPFLLHPEEVKYRQVGAVVKSEIFDNEVITAGTLFKYDAKTATCEFLRIWGLEEDKGSVKIKKTWLSPVLKKGMTVAVIDDTTIRKELAKGNTEITISEPLTIGELSEEGDYYVDAAITAKLKKGSYLVECKNGKIQIPNTISTRDTFKGEQNLMSFPRGSFSAYANTINPIPEAFKPCLLDGGLCIAWEYFAEKEVK